MRKSNGRGYLHPHACFACRKALKRALNGDSVKCPECGSGMVPLNRKFSPPKMSAVEEWNVVEFIVRAGFRYQSIELETGERAAYPKTMREAREFVVKYKDRLR